MVGKRTLALGILSLALCSAGMLTLEANRQKLPVTKDKVTGSVLDLIRSNEDLEAENQKLKAAQSQVSTKWLIVNLTGKAVTVLPEGAKGAVAVPANGQVSQTTQAAAPSKSGDALSLTLEGQHTSVKLKAGEVLELAGGAHARVDFLSGAGAWFVLVSE